MHRQVRTTKQLDPFQPTKPASASLSVILAEDLLLAWLSFPSSSKRICFSLHTTTNACHPERRLALLRAAAEGPATKLTHQNSSTLSTTKPALAFLSVILAEPA
jgi:hypothetical protein